MHSGLYKSTCKSTCIQGLLSENCRDAGINRRWTTNKKGQVQPRQNRMHEGRQQNARRQTRGLKPQEIGDKGRQSMRSRRLLMIKPGAKEVPRQAIYILKETRQI